MSVVLPVHQGEAWLSETLESVAAEDSSGIELIIRDSSPHTRCGDIVRAFGERLRIDYQHCPDVVSWTAKTNEAVAAAGAPHVSMLHQDDLWLPGRAAVVHAAIGAHPEAVLLLNPSRIIDGNSRALGLWRCPLRPGLVDRQVLLDRLLVQNFVAIPAPVIRRDAWLAIGGMDESLWYTPDWDLYLKLSGYGPAFYSDEVTTAFRIHSTSQTVTGSRNRVDFEAQMTGVLERHIGAATPSLRHRIRKVALASVTINVSLAAAADGDRREMVKVIRSFFGLSPAQLFHYLRDSRIAERVLPRLQAKLAGIF